MKMSQFTWGKIQLSFPISGFVVGDLAHVRLIKLMIPTVSVASPFSLVILQTYGMHGIKIKQETNMVIDKRDEKYPSNVLIQLLVW